VNWLPPSSKRDQARYRELVSDEAAARQIAEAKERFYCCGELKADGHHPVCPKALDERTHVEGQESLGI
jgi:hypothetical protein